MSALPRSLVLLSLFCSGCALTTLMTKRASFPDHAGEIAVHGIQAAITLERDDYGVPHVQASTPSDGWYALGFAHGQDRLFQADLTRRLGRGEVSAWLGPKSVHFDRFVRSLDLPALGRRAYAASSPETRAMIDAYTDGLNAAAVLKHPVEYRLLGVEFEPWRPEDCAIIGFLQAWSLEGNLKQELVALALADTDPAVVDRMLRSNPDTPAFDDFWAELRETGPYPLTEGFEAFTKTLGGRVENLEASNAWIVDGSKTASGLPMVVNDPHLTQRAPSLWYLAELQAGDLHVTGASIPGMPGFPLGHNDDLAWGLTNLMADVVDVAVLERADIDHVVIGGEKVRLERRSIAIEVKDAPPETGEVLVTPIGPVISEDTGGRLLVMRWQVLSLDDRLMELTHALATTPTVEEILGIVRTTPMGPTQNLHVADTTGDWAWQAVGSVPKRRGFTGRVPHPGSDPAITWDGWLTDLPFERRPAPGTEHRGFYVNANNPPDHPLKDAISTTYSPMLRHDLIAERLEAMDDIDVAAMQELQLDVTEGGAERFLESLLGTLDAPPEGPGRACYDTLQAWDRQATVDSVGTTVWASFQRSLVDRSLADLPADQRHQLIGVISAGRHPLNGEPEAFHDADLVRSALAHACEDLDERFGGPVPWGQAHTLSLKHPFAAKSALLNGWNMPEVPYPGTADTIAAASFSYSADDFGVTMMPSVRLVMPLDDLEASTLVHPGGQSGNPGHRNYRSHWNTWLAGRSVVANAQPVADTLTLTPR